jgi:type II secretory pathway pseudopilin PulG
MSVRSHFPWPLRWAMAALVFGFSAAIALWAFEFGKDIAGLDRNAKEELATLKNDLAQLRDEHSKARHVADTSESLLKTERAAQERLAMQLRQLEAEKQSLQEDLGFFERLLPSSGDGLQVRGLQAEAKAPGQMRYQMLVVQNGKVVEPFSGRYEVVLTGQLDGKSWSFSLPGGPRSLQLKQYGRVEGLIDHPATAVIKAVQVRVIDAKGATRAAQTLKL